MSTPSAASRRSVISGQPSPLVTASPPAIKRVIMEEQKEQLSSPGRAARQVLLTSPASKAFTAGLASATASSNTSLATNTTTTPHASHVLPPPYHLRTSAVLLQCLDHLALVSALQSSSPTRASSGRSSSSTSSSSAAPPPPSSFDLFSLLQQHQQLSTLFSSLHSHRASLSGLSNKGKLLSVQRDLAALSSALTQSVAAMSTQLHMQGGDAEQDNKNRRDLDYIVRLLQRARDELGGGVTAGSGDVDGGYSRLWSSVEEEELKLRRLKEKKELNERNAATISQLQASIKAEEEQYQFELRAVQSDVDEAHRQYKHFATLIHNSAKYDREDSAARVEAVMRDRRETLRSLQQSLSQMKAGIRNSARVHKANQLYLNHNKATLEQQLSEWQDRLETETGNDRQQYAELLAKRNEEVRVLMERQKQWDDDERLRREELRERQEMEAANSAKAEESQRRELSARKIQFAWRVFWRRRRVELKKQQKLWQKQQKQQQSAQ